MVVEDPEEFTAHLITTQDFVTVNASYATVVIEDDDDGKFVYLANP